ncbi:riboflavin synthase [Ktedonobacter racemifer]|uniref:Riboflavin synthase n=1 Tax=Ktedonobacter racemifer DSM 44963 TaxID=485913 RepID=D6U4K6_KTERA|nr:riboflavin synthase [Ktedonobacter racemifer]EFH81436.1 riboflavin synthase, alpha subunit [Ktedonobacter racemifer DSM 44963]
MFSGIVEELGILKACGERGLTISASLVLADLEIKDSIAVDGTCLTVTEMGPDWFYVDTMPETLRRTRLGSLKPGDKVNLERSLPNQGRIGGHMVQGHIEATAPILNVAQDGMALQVEVALPSELRSYIIPKGFIALNGVSLTIIDVLADHFTFALIPYTQEHTNLGEARPGMLLNIESDIIGRYVVQHLQHYVGQEAAIRQ